MSDRVITAAFSIPIVAASIAALSMLWEGWIGKADWDIVALGVVFQALIAVMAFGTMQLWLGPPSEREQRKRLARKSVPFATRPDPWPPLYDVPNDQGSDTLGQTWAEE